MSRKDHDGLCKALTGEEIERLGGIGDQIISSLLILDLKDGKL